ncbi:hypothetical protein N7520_009610 [Penicillium odoratum]|uniref:uncharacterized protein n=1 Tax=Penicillium odoratum TaxID=1167516 RepID=UPI00254768DA|nr:uncharacterized protein N7520_009610 [Penicillium odoratum]KAJ5752693.1 hypothetical protein N7520_009610 [Penicillium odoratum]
MGMTTRSQRVGLNPQLPDSPARRPSPVPEAANPAISPEYPNVEDFFLAEDDSHDEDDSHFEDESHDEDYFLVSIAYDYSTITARARSFQGIVLAGATPLQLAQNGFYYRPSGVSNMACCFACQSTKHLSTFQSTPFEEVQQLHEEDCVWQIISCDLKHHLGTPNKPPSSTTAFSSSKRSTPTADSSTQTTDSSTKSQTQSTPITFTTAKERLNTNLDCRSNPLPAIIDPEPQQPPTAHSPQLHQTIPSIPSSPQDQQTTYASVLQRPVTSIPQPTPPVQEPFLPANPILTIKDLHHRFHNKPSPFQLENKTSQRSIKRTRNKTTSVTHSLSRFLASALPAFSRFLAEMQPKSDTPDPSHPQFHYSRAMRAA